MLEESLLDKVLAPGSLSTKFQPIYEVNSERAVSLHALECLIRGPRGTNLESPNVLFEYVRRKRAESTVDRACVALALETARHLPGTLSLNLNVHASTLGLDPEFVTLLLDLSRENEIDATRLTIEIVEHAPFWDGPGFLRALSEIRGAGMQVALDDVGLGQSNYRMMLDCRPDYFKIDRYLIHGCEKDRYRTAILESIVTLAERFGARAVAEGVEQPEDLEVVYGMGIELVQGYLLGRPAPVEDFIDFADEAPRADKLMTPDSRLLSSVR